MKQCCVAVSAASDRFFVLGSRVCKLPRDAEPSATNDGELGLYPSLYF